MATDCDLTISFAAAGNSPGYLDGGWARPEAEFTWCIGAESRIVLPPRAPTDEYVLTLDVVPFMHFPALPGQRLIVLVNDTVVGSARLSRPALLGYRIPGNLIRRSERMVITLDHPDAARPLDYSGSSDDRYLAFAVSEAKLYRVTGAGAPDGTAAPPGLMLGPWPETVRGGHADMAEWAKSRTGLTIPEIALKFESLGENCEFGLFQRRCDAEPLGLLRFSSTFLRNLLRGIDSGFEGLGTLEDIDPRLEGEPRREFMIHEKRYGLLYHSFVYEEQGSTVLMREQEASRLTFLRRKFLEDLASGDKIFVYKFNAPVSQEEILPLHMALHRRGGSTLLWVVPAEADRPAGTVEVLMPGLLKGYIEQFAPPENAHDLSFSGWLRICPNACVLSRL